MKKLENQIINEIFRQLTLTLTLEWDVPVRPMDVKGLNAFLTRLFFFFFFCTFRAPLMDYFNVTPTLSIKSCLFVGALVRKVSDI